MPDIARSPLRMDCNGVDLAHPVDRIPPGYFPFLTNARVVLDGRIDSRPGYSAYTPTPLSTLLLHSIRRLNDFDRSLAAAGYTYIVGDGTELWQGTENTMGRIDTGYSGDPLSLITFRPENSPESWMYVYDANKQVKVRPDGLVRNVGVAPPGPVTNVGYGVPAMATLSDGEVSTGWTASGAATAIGAAVDRTNGGCSVGSILYDSGTTGWCCINPTPFGGQTFWMGQRMRVKIDSETDVLVREIHPAIVNTTVASILYDTGTTGPCTLLLLHNPSGLARNSLIQIDSEVVRVLSVTPSLDNTSYSMRCVTTVAHVAGAAVTGLVSWYAYTTVTHAAAAPVVIHYVPVTQGASGTGDASLLISLDDSKANNRPISLSEDYMHISLFLQNPDVVTKVNLVIDISAGTTNLGNAFAGDYWTYTISAAQLNKYGPGNLAGDSWTEALVPLASGVRTGNDLTRNFSQIKAIRVELVATGACAWGFDCWYIFGTYGPFVQPNSPVGLLYQSRNRDSTTGAASVPGPQTRYEVFPLREQVLVTPQTSTDPAVDSLDIYRLGNTLTTFTYVGTVVNNVPNPQVFQDNAPDDALLANPGPDLTLIQPWPVVDNPWSGLVNVIGTTVQRDSGDPFNTSLLSGTVILINGVAYQTYGQPRDHNFLEITQSGGVQFNVPYSIANPILAGQALPFAFGPLEGPFAPVVFALGDPVNPGTLYFSNAAGADAASDQNTLELCPPGEPLISGDVWNGLCICGSRDNVYLVRYSYLATIGASSNLSYQFSRLPSTSGFWSRWSCCRAADGVYFLGRDGIYRATDQGAVNVSDGQLYPLFPHDGQAAFGSPDLAPVDMSNLSALRLSSADEDIYFDYLDINGNGKTIRYDIVRKRWFPHDYRDDMAVHYLVEASVDSPVAQTLLMLSRDLGYIWISGGNADVGINDVGQLVQVSVTAIVQTPSIDAGDERAQKLYVDAMTDAEGQGVIQAFIRLNNNTVGLPYVYYTPQPTRQQFITNIASLPLSSSEPGFPSPGPPTDPGNLALYRNISVRYSWVGGPAGPKVYAFEPSFYLQPYLSSFLATQFINLSYPGWKMARRFYPAIISNSEVLFWVQCQDGRTYGPYTIPSSGGQLRIEPMILDAGVKDLALAFQLDGQGLQFALFPEAFTVELKGFADPNYIPLAIFKS